MAKLLVRRGANVTIADNDEGDALENAILTAMEPYQPSWRVGFDKVIEFLLKHNCMADFSLFNSF